jgi:catechol 2,3-dioxygenase-like lactoylglutathione lyase family enzyme
MKPRIAKTTRRILWLTLVLFFAAVFSAAAQPKVLGVGAIGLTVADMDRSVQFFSQVLTFKKVADVEFHDPQFDRLTGIFGARVRIATMKLGEETITLTEYLNPPGRPIPWDSRSNDRWFQHIAIVVRDMDVAYARLRRFKVKPISTAPQRIPDWNQAAAGIRAFYFRDPDNHALELIYFPPCKGDPRWQRPTEALFLGIDHTAIAVGNTEQSLKFYRDLLGLKVAGESLNYGMEQEYLSRVAGARVRITGLRAPEGPGIEFLEYLHPQDGRPYPQDAGPNDLWNWQTNLLVQDLGDFFNRLKSHNVSLISPKVFDIKSMGRGVKKAALIRDPDGHALGLVER